MPTRILIAEDNAVVRTAVRQLLENAGDWEIAEVENGQQAVTHAQERKPNLIILDLVMPVMDGLVAARELSKLMPDVPLVMHTLHWSPQVELEAQNTDSDSAKEANADKPEAPKAAAPDDIKESSPPT
jgi:CheY-like chemotaxis protein